MEEEQGDPTRPSLDSMTTAGHAFALPWRRETISLLTGFNSNRMKDAGGPWMSQSPFEMSDLKMATILSDTKGGTATYRDGLSTSAGTCSEHISASLGLTIGYPFLNANVSAKYDRDVVEKKSVSHSSVQLLITTIWRANTEAGRLPAPLGTPLVDWAEFCWRIRLDLQQQPCRYFATKA